MTKYILALCALAALSSCSGGAKACYGLEANWDYEGWRHSCNGEEEVVNVEVTADDTYTVGPGGCVG